MKTLIHKHKKQGFTLIELLVVIAIIGVLSSVVLVSLDQARARARDTERKETMRQIQLALELYYSDHGSFPPNKDPGYVYFDNEPNFLSELVLGGYLPNTAIDPLSPDHRYGYYFYGGACGYVIFSDTEDRTQNRAVNNCGGSAGSSCGPNLRRDCIQGGGA